MKETDGAVRLHPERQCTSRGRTAYSAHECSREKIPSGPAQALEKSRFAEANERIFLPFSFLWLPPFLSPASRSFSFPSLHSRHVIAVWRARLAPLPPRQEEGGPTLPSGISPPAPRIHPCIFCFVL